MQLSLCLTTYNRTDLLYQSFEKVIDDPRISEIIIVDDASTPDIVEELKNAEQLKHPKVKLFFNDLNLGMSRNKKKSLDNATNEWIILFDSDNIIGPEYLDALEKTWLTYPPPLNPGIIFAPDFAAPQFDYRHMSGRILQPWKVASKLRQGDNMLGCFLNTCNYVVNKLAYQIVWQYRDYVKGTDTINFNYDWLAAGNHFMVVKGMQYEHRVHDGSGFMEDAQYNLDDAKKVEDKIKATL